MTPITLGDQSYEVCDRCLAELQRNVEQYHWFDRFTESDFERVVAYLRSLDEIWCVKDHAYRGGELWVHTPYVDAAVVRDVCDNYGLKIRWFQIVSPATAEWDCLEDHGPCVEINLVYDRDCPPPLPGEPLADPIYTTVDWLDEDDKYFTWERERDSGR